MTKKQVTYSDHAEQRMFERGISKETVEGIIDEWDVIEEDLKERRYILWGRKEGMIIHVACLDEKVNYHVITVYNPSKSYFSEKSNYRERIE